MSLSIGLFDLSCLPWQLEVFPLLPFVGPFHLPRISFCLTSWKPTNEEQFQRVKLKTKGISHRVWDNIFWESKMYKLEKSLGLLTSLTAAQTSGSFSELCNFRTHCSSCCNKCLSVGNLSKAFRRGGTLQNFNLTFNTGSWKSHCDIWPTRHKETQWGEG